MQDEIRHAFDHPSARAQALDGGLVQDRISLRDHIVAVEIGAFQSERGVRQRLRFNIVVEVSTTGVDAADDVDRILSYDCLTDAIAVELADERLNLLETLAERVADRILLEPQALRVFVRVEKLDRGPGALGVEIVRDGASQADMSTQKSIIPNLIVITPAALVADELSAWLDKAEQNDGPSLICVAPASVPAPATQHPLAQRRIDLLALDQWAWVLAGSDSRCVVVATRTELDWALENQKLSVWAPSKLVLDAVDGPASHDFYSLMRWFSGQMGADENLISQWPPAES